MLTVLRLYLEISLVLSLIGALFLAFQARVLSDRAPRRSLTLAYLLIAGSLLFPIAFEFLPRESLPRPRSQIWSGTAPRSEAAMTWIGVPRGARISSAKEPAFRAGIDSASLRQGATVAGTFLLALLAALTLRLARLHFTLARSPLVRRIGRIRIHVGHRWNVPFSAWVPGRARIFIPSSIPPGSAEFRLVLAHEIEHHRARDVPALLGLELVKTFQIWNPVIRALARRLGHLQELACDETLIGRRRFSPEAYSRCLLRVAETAVALRSDPVGTASMARGRDGIFLMRRITMILRPSSPETKNRGRSFGLAAALVLALVSSAYAAKSLVQDRALSLEEAAKFARSASREGGIPLSMNEKVLARLNRYVATPDGRDYVKKALARLPKYRAMIEAKLLAAGQPIELAAIPLFESGYDNDARSSMKAAGIWQFIPTTAKRYGLEVSETRDERLDVEKETDAAIRYYRDLHNIFQDWHLALKAYNEGESRVMNLIKEHGTRDAWTLERKDSRENYLSGATAMMILMKHPELVN